MTTRKINVGLIEQVIHTQFLKDVEGMPEGDCECVTLSTPRLDTDTAKLRILTAKELGRTIRG